MTKPYSLWAGCLSAYFLFWGITLSAQEVKPVFQDGEAQIIEAFNNPDTWLRHDLFVETDFDTDGDGKKDRMHVSVTRSPQTEESLKLPKR